MRRLRSRTSHVTLASLALVAAATAGAQTTGENGAALEKCDKPIGTLAVVEPQDEVITALTRYRLQSPTGLIRLMVQQSNCFQVVERGAGMRNIMQERELAQSGQLQTASNVGGGQLRAADFVLTPNVLFSEGNAGGVGGAVGGFLGRRNPVLGVVAGGLKFKEAQTNILVADTRSGMQVAAAEGKARKKDFSLGALGYAGGAVGGAGGYTNTNEGKVVAASFLDNYNAIVRAVRADPSLQRMAAAPGGAAAAGAKAGAVFAEGDVLVPKIANVKVFAAPAESGQSVGVLGKTDELVCTGEERNGYVKVQSGSVEGWVRKTLVRKP
jgi:curli biogenesis system outer membrane secretion channel CsgG